jgi:hypothetical protein
LVVSHLYRHQGFLALLNLWKPLFSEVSISNPIGIAIFTGATAEREGATAGSQED